MTARIDSLPSTRRYRRATAGLGLVGVLLGMAFAAAAFTPAAFATARPAAAGTAIGLDLKTTKSSYATGEAPVFQVAVTNNGTAACSLAQTPAGTLHMLDATRDGQPLAPELVRTAIVDGFSQSVAVRSQAVEVGQSRRFEMVAAQGHGLPLSAPLRDGAALTALWPLDANGDYRLRLAYEAPIAAGENACAGLSNSVDVRFSVGTNQNSLLLILLAVALLVLIAGLAVWLLIRRRRGRTGGTAAVAAAVLLASLAATTGVVVFATQPAYAGIVYGPNPSGPIHGIFSGCLGKIQASDPDLFTALTGSNSPQTVVWPWFYSSHEKLKGGGPRDSMIRWDPYDTSPFAGEPSGAALDPCASLYHELNHARDRADNAESIEQCGNTGIPVDEVRATLAENRYRAKNGLPQRTTYDGKKLPKSLNECVPPKRKDQKQAGLTPPVCRGVNGCGRSVGDPHLQTFDGVYYSFQAVGEFVVAASTKNGFQVQARQRPYQNSRTVSVNTAVAMNVDGVRLGFSMTGGEMVIRQNGKELAIPYGETALPGGGRLSRQADHYNADAYVVLWADGTIAWLEMIGRWGIHLSIEPAETHRGALRGLLGNFDGNPDDDKAPPFAERYKDFAAKARVTQATSLFDYAAGETTQTFTDTSFPDTEVTVASLTAAQREPARAACAMLGVTQPQLLDACIVDLASTGQPAFATRMADVQVLTDADQGVIGSTQEVSIGQPGGRAEVAIDVIAGQRIYVKVTSSIPGDSCGALQLVDTANLPIAIGCLLGGKGEIDGTVLKTAGRYRIVIDPAGDAVGSASVQVVASVDAETQLVPDGADAVASVTAPGGVAWLVFPATAGQKVFVDVLSSSLPSGCGAVTLATPGNAAPIAIGCTANGVGLIDTTTLRDAGQYAVRLDPPNDVTGTVKVRLNVVTDHEAPITVDGPAVTATVAEAGSVSLLTFTGTAGQRIAADLSDSTLPAGCGSVSLVGADGGAISLGCTKDDGTGTLDAITLTRTGSYAIRVDGPDRRTGTMKVRLRG